MITAYLCNITDFPSTFETTMIDAQRLQEINSFAHPQDRIARIVGELLLRYAIRHLAPNTPFPLVRVRDEYGKPILIQAPNMHFSISHSGDFVICAVSDVPVGVDIEVIREISPRLPQRVCTADEKIWLQQRAQASFFDLWVRKEAAVKALGVGLRLPLKSFSVLGDSLILQQKKIYFSTICMPNGYCGCVCMCSEFQKRVSNTTLCIDELIK